jgi:4-hydroxy-3-methylbut-2-en-1-yl diphosphate reductase
MKIIRAAHLGMCFGVRDAIALAGAASEVEPLTILGELVHNEVVLSRLRMRGIRFENRAAKAGTPAVMITAHGMSETSRRAAEQSGRRVLDATCPLVHYAHRAVKKLARDGFHPIIVGQRDHVEVRGLTEDLAEFDVILTEAEAMGLKERPRYGVAAQTTQPVERLHRLADVMRKQFPRSEIRLVDTVCSPTKQRQAAAVEVAAQSDVVIVVGGTRSNNTRELAATCRGFCLRVHQVEQASDLCGEWFAGAEVVGLTAGTSTPAEVIDEVEAAILRRIAEPSRERAGIV